MYFQLVAFSCANAILLFVIILFLCCCFFFSKTHMWTGKERCVNEVCGQVAGDAQP